MQHLEQTHIRTLKSETRTLKSIRCCAVQHSTTTGAMYTTTGLVQKRTYLRTRFTSHMNVMHWFQLSLLRHISPIAYVHVLLFYVHDDVQ